MTIDLSDVPGSQPVIAVDAKLDYHEIDKGLLKAGLHTIHLNRTSDWALAVGESGEGTSGYAGHPEEERR